jgi:hypothetical protein
MNTKTSAFSAICLGLIIALVVWMAQAITDNYTKGMEKAYFEGQKDAISGDLRIKKTVDGCWIWTRSCWNDGKIPQFNPSIVCGK